MGHTSYFSLRKLKGCSEAAWEALRSIILERFTKDHAALADWPAAFGGLKKGQDPRKLAERDWRKLTQSERGFAGKWYNWKRDMTQWTSECPVKGLRFEITVVSEDDEHGVGNTHRFFNDNNDNSNNINDNKGGAAAAEEEEKKKKKLATATTPRSFAADVAASAAKLTQKLNKVYSNSNNNNNNKNKPRAAANKLITKDLQRKTHKLMKAAIQQESAVAAAVLANKQKKAAADKACFATGP